MSGIRDALVAELERHGITKHSVVVGGKHPRLLFEVNGRKRFYVFPGTMFDGRARRAVVGELRRMLRREGAVVMEAKATDKPGKARKPSRRKPALIVAPVLEPVAAEDPFAALRHFPTGPAAPHLAAIDARLDLALYRLSLFRGSYRRWVSAGRPAV